MKGYSTLIVKRPCRQVRYEGDEDENAAMVATQKSKTKPKWETDKEKAQQAVAKPQKPKWKGHKPKAGAASAATT